MTNPTHAGYTMADIRRDFPAVMRNEDPAAVACGAAALAVRISEARSGATPEQAALMDRAAQAIAAAWDSCRPTSDGGDARAFALGMKAMLDDPLSHWGGIGRPVMALSALGRALDAGECATAEKVAGDALMALGGIGNVVGIGIGSALTALEPLARKQEKYVRVAAEGVRMERAGPGDTDGTNEGILARLDRTGAEDKIDAVVMLTAFMCAAENPGHGFEDWSLAKVVDLAVEGWLRDRMEDKGEPSWRAAVARLRA